MTAELVLLRKKLRKMQAFLLLTSPFSLNKLGKFVGEIGTISPSQGSEVERRKK